MTEWAPGPELDVAIGRLLGRVVSFTEYEYGKPEWCVLHENGDEWERLPRYSTQIGAAWAIMDWMLEQPDQTLYLRFVSALQGREHWIVAPGHLAALRLCRAALAVTSVEVPV